MLLPAVFFTVKLMVYFPALVYFCEGFLAVDVVLSPKFHDHDVGLLILLSVNFTVIGAFSEIGDAEKAATGDLNIFAATFTLLFFTTGFIELPLSSSISVFVILRSVVPAFFPVSVIVPNRTLVLPDATRSVMSTASIQTEPVGTAEFECIDAQPGKETAVICAIFGSETEIVILKPDNPAGTLSITIWTF